MFSLSLNLELGHLGHLGTQDQTMSSSLCSILGAQSRHLAQYARRTVLAPEEAYIPIEFSGWGDVPSLSEQQPVHETTYMLPHAELIY